MSTTRLPRAASTVRRGKPAEPESFLQSHRRSLLIAGGIGALLFAYLYWPSGLFGSSRRLATFPVRGSASFEGKALAGATLILHPVGIAEADELRPQATVRPDGMFSVGTYGVDDGAPAGQYKVTVHWYGKPSKSEDAPPPRSLLPQRYASPDTSGLAVTVQTNDNDLPAIALRR